MNAWKRPAENLFTSSVALARVTAGVSRPVARAASSKLDPSTVAVVVELVDVVEVVVVIVVVLVGVVKVVGEVVVERVEVVEVVVVVLVLGGAGSNRGYGNWHVCLPTQLSISHTYARVFVHVPSFQPPFNTVLAEG